MTFLLQGPASRRPLALVAIVVALTACGEESRLSKHAYEQKLRSEYADVQQAFRATGSSFGQPDLPKKIAAAQNQLRDAADALDDAKPPEAVEEENEEIIEGLRDYADDLGEVRTAAERGDLKAIEAFNARVADNEAVKRIAEAAEEMKRKGYDVGPIGQD